MDQIYNKYTLQKKKINEIPVLINDMTSFSSNYFNIQDLTYTFTGGKNLIQILGKRNKLVSNTNVYIEILDVNNNTIYYEISTIKGENNERYVIPYIFSDTPIGIGKIIIAGTAKYDLDNNLITGKWANIINVKWSTDININRELRNNTPILFKNEPNITIDKLNSSYYTLSPSETITTSLGTVSYEYIEPNLSYIYSKGFEFTSDMLHGSISVAYPITDQPQAEGNAPYEGIITEIISNNVAIVSPRYYIVIPPSPFAYFINKFSDSSYTLTYTIDVDGIENNEIESKSYLKLGVNNLNILSGDIYRSRLYFRDKNYNSSYELLDDFVYEPQTMLIDYTDMNNQISYGRFMTQSIIDNYWECEYDNVLHDSNLIELTLNSNYLLNSMLISSSNLYDDDHFILKQINPVYFHNNIDYTLNFNMNVSNYNDVNLMVYISGSAFITENILGKKIIDTTLNQTSNVFNNYIISPTISGEGSLLFKLNADKSWILNNIEITTKLNSKHSQQAYTKFIATPIDHLSSVLTFKLEYFNYENVQSIDSSYVDLGDSIVYTDPSLNLTLDKQSLTFEIGSIENIALTSSFITNDAGDVVSRNIKRESTVISNDLSQNVVYDIDYGITIQEQIQYSTEVTYSMGPIKNNSIGEPFPYGRIKAGSIIDYAYIYGKNKVFAGVSSSFQSTNINNDWIRNPDNYQQDPFLTTPLNFNIAVSDEDIFTWIITPLEKPIQSIVLVQSSNAEILQSFNKTTITIKDGGGIIDLPCNLYYEELNVPNSYNVTYSVFIP